MPLIDCPDCGHKVSRRAPTCPQCGAPIAQPELQDRPATVAKVTGNKPCPTCGRQISANNFICPFCGQNQPQRSFASPLTIVLGLAALGIVLIASGFGYKLWVHLIAPFDPKPTASFTELIAKPDAIKELHSDLCNWVERENIRNPSWQTEAVLKNCRKKRSCKRIASIIKSANQA